MPQGNEPIQAADARLKSHVHGKVNHLWWAFMLRGALALMLGVSAIIWPKATLGVLVQLIGIYALLDGATGLISSIRNRDLQSYLLPALISLAVGAILLFWPGLTVKWLLIILGILALLHGANLLLAGLSMAQYDPNRGMLMTMGTVLAIAGLILIIWPDAGTVTISWLVAIFAFVIGAILVFLALRLRQVNLHLRQK